MVLPASLLIHAGSEAGTGIFVDGQGVIEFGSIQADWADFQCQERVDREIAFVKSPKFRLLIHHTMLEFYLDDIFIQSYTMELASNGTISFQNVTNLKLWQRQWHD